MPGSSRFIVAAAVAISLAPAHAPDPCKLLTKAQVETVLPHNDGGMVVHSGGSLIAGVDAYQCSYSNDAADVFTVVLNVTVDDQHFDKIRPHFEADEATKVPVGAGGWLRGDPNDLKLTAVRGRTVLDLELLATDAKAKGPALVALAQTAIGHL
jgi:hypothetical protein